MPNKLKKISVVIPVYNEGDNLPKLYKELTDVMLGLSNDYEILFIDDGSRDNTREVLEDMFNKDNHVRAISLVSNQGKAAALNVGFRQTSGDIVVVIDGDGQHDPKYIPQFVSAIEDGYDMASSWKEEDKGRNGLKSFIHSKVNIALGKVMGVKLRYFGSAMKAYRKELVKNLELWGDLHRFVGALVYHKGMKIKEIPINIRPRESGVSHYSFKKIAWKIFLDIMLVRFLTKYAKTPFRVFGTIGTIFVALGIIGVLYVAYYKYFLGINVFYNSTELIVSMFLFIMGIQFIFFGLMAELISRAYYTSEDKISNMIQNKLER